MYKLKKIVMTTAKVKQPPQEGNQKKSHIRIHYDIRQRKLEAAFERFGNLLWQEAQELKLKGGAS